MRKRFKVLLIIFIHRDVTDSRSAIQAITKHCNRNKLVQHIILDSDLNVNLCWVPSHVGIAQNECVIQPEYIENAQLLREDIKSIIKNVVNKKWNDSGKELLKTTFVI